MVGVQPWSEAGDVKPFWLEAIAIRLRQDVISPRSKLRSRVTGLQDEWPFYSILFDAR
jgi:hypothetical protein